MRRASIRASFLLVAIVALSGWAAADQGAPLGPVGANPGAGASRTVSAPSIAPSTSPGPTVTTLFGALDPPAMEQRFGSPFTPETITDTAWIRYVATIGAVTVDFVVDPNDPTAAIIRTGVRIDDVTTPTAAETDAVATWFAFLAPTQPAAVTWIRDHLVQYQQAPGADLNAFRTFGSAKASFHTYKADPTAARPPAMAYFWMNDSLRNPSGA